MSIWADLAVEGYDLAQEKHLITRLKRFFRRKKKVLVLGASGSGKTQLINSLIDPLSYPIPKYQRTIAVHGRKVNAGEFPFIMIDTPGQRLDEAKRKKVIADAIRKGMEGIINVACFGYHEAEEADKEAAVQTKGAGIAKADYLEERRGVETDLLSEWVPFIDKETARWVLTVVTKADLWWPSEEKVREYYEQGRYGEILGDVELDRSVLPYCSIIEPFYGTKTSGRFGDRERSGTSSTPCVREGFVATHSKDPDKWAEQGGPGDNPDPFKVDVQYALGRLWLQADSLRRNGIIVVWIAIVALLFVVTSGILRVLPVSSVVRVAVALGGMFLSLLGILWLLVWDRQRREAMVVYEEVSDEVEWRHRIYRKGPTPENEPSGNKAVLGVRVALRRFLTSTDLPFAPGPQASTVYVVYFILIIICFVMIVLLSGPAMNF